MGTTSSVEERLAHIEGRLESFATKADIAELRGELSTLKWTISIGLFAVIAITSILQVLLQLLPIGQ